VTSKRNDAAGRRVRVIVADDHPLYRDGLAGAIREHPALDLVGEASNGRDALQLIERHAPDVALLDVKMKVDGPTVLRRLADSAHPTRVVFLSAFLDSALIYAALEAGAAGYLSKRDDRSAICAALKAAARGEVVLSPAAQTALGRQIRSNRRPDPPALTQREQEVLRLAAEGMSAPEIGAHLFLSPATVKTHLAHVYDKLGVSDRSAAVAEGFRRGLLD
jgi:two-component system, NarL family, nitrate/nitrite response regulator NarL